MLRVYDDIAVAMQRSAALAYPLLVFVHDGLPEHFNNTREATTTATFCFLPSDDANHSGASLSCSAQELSGSPAAGTVDDSNANTTPSLPAPSSPGGLVVRYNKENAHLGKLKSVVDGPINVNFPLGKLKGGVAQKEAVTVTLLNMRFGNVCLVHFIDATTQSYQNFLTAMPSQQPRTLSTPRLHIFPPTFFVQKEAAVQAACARENRQSFIAQSVYQRPVMLAGDDLTPATLHDTVRGLLQLPVTELISLSGCGKHYASIPRVAPFLRQGGNASSASGPDNSEDPHTFLHVIARMNAEAQRQRENERAARENLMNRPVLPGGHAVATAPAVSQPSSSSSPSTSTMAAVTTENQNKRSRAPPLPNGMHLIQIDNLPPRGSRKKTLLTSASMTARTAWVEVEKLIEKAKKEIADAKEANDWDGVECEVDTDNFYLQVVTPADESAGSEAKEQGDAVAVIRSAAEAAEVRLQSFPSGTKIHVFKTGSAPTLYHAAATTTTTTTSTTVASEGKAQTADEAKREKEVNAEMDGEEAMVTVCDGDVCRRVTKREAAEIEAKRRKTEEAKQTEAEKEHGKTEGKSTPSAPSFITIRCNLPDGSTETIANLDPATDTLQANLRPVIAARLNTEAFHFLCTFPPPARKFTSSGDGGNASEPQTNDEAKPLKALGLSTSCALRVVLAGHSSQPPSRPVNASAPANSYAVNPAEAAAASGILAQFARMLRGESGVDNNNRNAAPQGHTLGGRNHNDGVRPQQPQPQQQSNTSRPTGGGGGFRSMAQIRAAEEEEERAHARQEDLQERMQNLMGRGNRNNAHTDPNFSEGDGNGDGAAQNAMETLFKRLQAMQQQQQQQQGEGPSTLSPSSSDKRKKSNRYFGGDSTEFISAPATDDKDGDGQPQEDEEEEHRPHAFGGVGRRLADGRPAEDSNLSNPRNRTNPEGGETQQQQQHSPDNQKDVGNAGEKKAQ